MTSNQPSSNAAGSGSDGQVNKFNHRPVHRMRSVSLTNLHAPGLNLDYNTTPSSRVPGKESASSPLQIVSPSRMSMDDQDIMFRTSSSRDLSGLAGGSVAGSPPPSSSNFPSSFPSPTASFQTGLTSPVEVNEDDGTTDEDAEDFLIVEEMPRSNIQPSSLLSRSMTVPGNLGRPAAPSKSDSGPSGDDKRTSKTLGRDSAGIYRSGMPQYPVMAMGIPHPQMFSAGANQLDSDVTATAKKRSSQVLPVTTIPPPSMGPGLAATSLVKKRSTGAVAIASERENVEFHRLFRTVAPEDRLIDDFPCALRRDVTVRGRLWVSKHHLAFSSSNPFSPTLLIPLQQVIDIQKKNVALLIPNAIEIEIANLSSSDSMTGDAQVPIVVSSSSSSSSGASTSSSVSGEKPRTGDESEVLNTTKVFLSSFFDRDAVFELINKLWDLHVDPTSLKRKFPDVSSLRCSCGGQGTCETCHIRHQVVAQRKKDAFPFFLNTNAGSPSSSDSTSGSALDGKSSGSVLRRRSTHKKKSGTQPAPLPLISKTASQPPPALLGNESQKTLPASITLAVTDEVSVDSSFDTNGIAMAREATIRPPLPGDITPIIVESPLKISPPNGALVSSTDASGSYPVKATSSAAPGSVADVTPWDLAPGPISPVAVTAKELEKARKEKEKEEKRMKKEADKEEKKLKKLAEKAEKAEKADLSAGGYVSAGSGGGKMGGLKKWIESKGSSSAQISDGGSIDRSSPTPVAELSFSRRPSEDVKSNELGDGTPTPSSVAGVVLPAAVSSAKVQEDGKASKAVQGTDLLDDIAQKPLSMPVKAVDSPPIIARRPRKPRAAPSSCGCRLEKKALPANLVTHAIEDKLYPLSFQSMVDHVYALKPDVGGGNFLVKYLVEKRKVMNLAVGEWKPPTVADSGPVPADKILKRLPTGGELVNLDLDFTKMGPGWHRVIEYTLPLSIPLGPKQTRCIIHEEVVSMKKGKYLCIKSKTKNPDIFDGFQVIARFCLLWNGPRKTRHIVDASVEFWKFTVIKMPIQNGAIDGVRGNCAALIVALEESTSKWPEGPVVSDDEYEEDEDVSPQISRPKRSSRPEISSQLPLRPEGSMGSDDNSANLPTRRTRSRGSSRKNSRTLDAVLGDGKHSPSRHLDDDPIPFDLSMGVTTLSPSKPALPFSTTWLQGLTVLLATLALTLMAFNTLTVWQLARATEHLGRGLGGLGGRVAEMERELVGLRATVDLLKGLALGNSGGRRADAMVSSAGDDTEALARAIVAAVAEMNGKTVAETK
ncbi:hypothetical protein HDU67_005450 [Dinochytrium kinnereticum]|nr:hypothetical protein HDU67_005450 [Dinochytrium kinnereticum]